jgi:hypothetical protein
MFSQVADKKEWAACSGRDCRFAAGGDHEHRYSPVLILSIPMEYTRPWGNATKVLSRSLASNGSTSKVPYYKNQTKHEAQSSIGSKNKNRNLQTGIQG